MPRVVKPHGIVLEFLKPKSFPIKQACSFIPESVAAFPERLALVEMITPNGYRDIQIKLSSGGIATIYVGIK